jgi:integrase
MFFDARAAKLLKPGDHMVIDGCPGLRLVATATRKTWTYRYKAPGATSAAARMKQLAMGQWPAVSVQAAAAQWQALREERSTGTDPGQERRAARQALKPGRDDPAAYLVRSLVLDFVTGHLEQQRKEAGALAARRMLERFLEEEPELADRPAATVTRADAFDVLDARKATPTAAAKLRSMLGSAWDYALDAGRLSDDMPNWWRMVMKGRLKSKGKIVGGKHVGQQRRTLPGAEIGQLLAWLPNMHELGRDTCEMYLWTCLRGVEILGLRAEHIGKEADGWWWTVPKALTKNARFEEAVDLRVPLIGRALEVVQHRLKTVGASGWLFEDVRGEQYTQHDFSTYIYSLQPYSAKARRRQGAGLVLPVAGWTPHNLRRSARTLLASLGCSDEIGEAIVGHLPSDIVGLYNAYTYDKERRLWLGKLSAHLGELALQAHAAALPARP